MSQKMAAFVLASMGKVCWRVFHCLFADSYLHAEYMNFGVPSMFLTLAIKKWPGLAGSTIASTVKRHKWCYLGY